MRSIEMLKLGRCKIGSGGSHGRRFLRHTHTNPHRSKVAQGAEYSCIFEENKR